MDLKFHELDVFIKSLHSWIDSNRLFGVNLQVVVIVDYFLLGFSYLPVRNIISVIFFC